MPKPALTDASLVETFALPNGAASTTSDAIQVGVTGEDFVAMVELLITAPLLVVGDLANAATMTYTVQHSDDAAFTVPVDLYGICLTQTGAGGVGAAAATKRVRLPTDVKPYVRLKATNSGAGDASDKSASLSLLF